MSLGAEFPWSWTRPNDNLCRTQPLAVCASAPLRRAKWASHVADGYEALLISESQVLFWSGRPPFRSLRPPLWPITACHSKCYSFQTPVNQTYSFRTSVNQTGLRDSSTGNTRKRLNSSLGREHRGLWSIDYNPTASHLVGNQSHNYNE